MMFTRSLLLSVALLGACAVTPETSRPQDAIPSPVAPTAAYSAIERVDTLRQAAARIATLPSDSRTLVVFDIDDTLLTTPAIAPGKRQFFGSDRWYLWQYAKPNLSPDKAGGGDVVPCLFDVIAMNYEVGSQEPTERDAAAIVAGVPFDRMILTSRSPDYRQATERQLKQAGFPLPVFPNLKGAADGIGFRARTNNAYVTYFNGVFMTKGGNKGKMLLELLDRPELKLAYENVVLVDDSQDKLLDMQAELAQAQVNFYGLRYEGIKKYPLPALTQDEKREARASWQAWQRFLQAQYPDRLRELAGKDGECKAIVRAQ